ncbi:TRAP transporter large permease [Endozoicomonas ascidiicola]|uniref:TRAP transporter large permease n=1 Tax=Endozoicomonas ascidiicola TaxID=1698521 RepID=UPI0008314D34|nr:TRAP transporter large permease subunit [Endozoicomonas ascidiicola]
MDANTMLVMAMFGSFILLLMSGYPVAWVLGGTAIAFAGIGYYSDLYFDTMTGLDFLTLGLLVNRLYDMMDNWILVALPMFIFMGIMLDKSGLAERLMNSMQRLLGRVHGGLAITVTLIGIILAASTGIIGASVVLLALISLPAMKQQNYHMPTALGTVASAGTLGILIPPSIMLVIMADQLALSVGDLFMAAVFPGLLLACFYVLYIVGKGMLKPEHMPVPDDAANVGWKEISGLFKNILPPLLLIGMVLGSIFVGIATPTEASGIGALGAMLLTIKNGNFNFKILQESLQQTFNTTAYIFAIFIGASAFALVLRELGGDELIESTLASLPFGPYGVIALILLMVFFLGFFLDWIEITLIILPLVAPVVGVMDLGINDFGSLDNPELLWFVILVALTLQTSFLTPPVGFALFYLKGVCPPEVTLKQIYQGVVPFIVLQLLALLVVGFWPELVTWLPSVAY